MRKIFVLLLIIFIFSLSSFLCSGEVVVTPPEISITMDEEFINGNTSEIITLANNNDFDVNLTWYIGNPDPSLRRPNRIDMPDLSWVYLEPRWCDTPPGDNAYFYIYLNIPESQENLNQSWEVWAIFELGANGFVNQEYAVRVYIDTPKKSEVINELTEPGQTSDLNLVIIIAIPMIILSSIAIFFITRKKFSSL